MDLTTPDRMAALAAAIDRSQPFARLSDAPLGEAQAYRMQDALAPALSRRWGPVAGWKIAANSPALMQRLDLAEPLCARVFAGMVHRTGAACGLERFTDIRIEPEIALILAGAPRATGAEGGFTPADLRAATGRLVPAIELIDMRGATRETAPMDEAVAQNISNIGAVLGGPGVTPEAFDAGAVAVRVEADGAMLAEAQGAAPQDPFAAAAWLAGKLAARGLALQAGQFILCGTHTDMLPLRPGARLTVAMPPMGIVAATL